MLPAIQCNVGVGKMFDTNIWNNQMNYTEDIMSSLTLNRKVKDLNKREYNEYVDLSCRHYEELMDNSKPEIILTNTLPASSKYA